MNSNTDIKDNMLEETYCRIDKCQFSGMHVSSYHLCELCKKHGHGVNECKKEERLLKLEQYRFDILPEKLWCVSKNCNNYWTHTTTEHICNLCRKLHVYEKCPKHPLNKFINKFNIKSINDATFCKVINCASSKTHVSLYHQCNNCHMKGHGEAECNNKDKITALEQFKYDILPEQLWCKSRNCKNYWTHTTEGHICYKCHVTHIYEKCPQYPLLQLCNERKCLDNKNVYQVKCAICRIISFCIDTEINAFGLTQECVICHENSIDVILPRCKHATYCKGCINKIKTEITEPINSDDPNLIKNLKTYGMHKFKMFKGFCYCNVSLTNGKIACIKQIDVNDEPAIMIYDSTEKKRIDDFIKI
jgi:hypothetical protein